MDDSTNVANTNQLSEYINVADIDTGRCVVVDTAIRANKRPFGRLGGRDVTGIVNRE